MRLRERKIRERIIQRKILRVKFLRVIYVINLMPTLCLQRRQTSPLRQKTNSLQSLSACAGYTVCKNQVDDNDSIKKELTYG